MKKSIRIISPSGAINSEYIEGAIQRLQSWGYDITEGAYSRGIFGRFSGTDEERLEDLQEALQDPTVEYILCSRGGYGLQRILNHIHAEIQKCIIGFSDITALHQLCVVRHPDSTNQRQVSLHGLMCKHIATLPEDSEAIRLFRKALAGESLSYEIPSHPLNRLGEATGTLIGGNLSVLYGLQDTPYSLNAALDVHPEGCILFIEDIGERHYHIDRMMHNLHMSGVLARINGLVVGQFTDCDPDPLMAPLLLKHGNAIYSTILEAVEEYHYPILFNFPAGHVDDNRPLWMNGTTTIKISNHTSYLTQPSMYL